MHVLIVGFDATIVPGSHSVVGDTLQRHMRYAEALRRRFPGGTLTVLVRVPPSWSAQPVQVSDSLTIQPVPCHRYLFLPSAWRVARELFSRKTFDVVSTQSPFDDGLLGVLLKRKYGVALNVQMRSSFIDFPYWVRERPLNRFLNIVAKWVAQRADTIRVICYGERERLVNRYPAWKEKIVVLHPLVNRDVFDPPVDLKEVEPVQRALRSHGLESQPFLLFVGRLVPEKNIPTLLRALARLRQAGLEAPLAICGAGPLQRSLGSLAARLGIADRVIWVGSLPLVALRGWYAAARVVALPSFYEGFGKVVAEAYLVGTPVVVTPFVSAAELVIDGQTGYVTRSFTNEAELAERIARLLTDARLAEEMGQRGQAHIREYLLDDATYLDRLVDIWRRTAERGGKHV